MFTPLAFKQPQLVTNGLVLYLDAGDRTSYVSGSTVWRDLSTSNASGSLTNGPTFDTGNGGSIVFDGSDDYVRTNIMTNLPSGGEARTMTYWVNPAVTSSAVLQPVFGFGYNTSGNGRFFMGIIGSTGSIAIWGNTINYYSPLLVSPNVWTQVTFVYANNYITAYKNGISDGGAAITLDTVANSQVQIGDGEGNPYQRLNGKVSCGYIYNRALSQAEITQNFNAQRQRFNI